MTLGAGPTMLTKDWQFRRRPDRSWHETNESYDDPMMFQLSRRVMVGLLFAGGLHAGVLFDFNDGSLQGWTDLTVAGSHDGPRHWAGAPPAFPGAGHDGTPGLGQSLVGGNQDSPHPVLWLRSPEFTLDGSGDLSVWLRGGTGSGSLAGQPESVVPAASTDPGFQGVALRDAGTGMFVLSGRKAANGDHWENIVFSTAQLAALDQGASYTLDLIDAGHGGWGWVTMDTVSIPGTTEGVAPPPLDIDAHEPTGPSSRRTGWAISELMFRPGPAAGGGFIEIHNTEPVTRDLDGHRLEGAVSFTFPAGTTVAAGGLVVVAADPAALAAAHGITGVLGPFAGSLNQAAGEVILRHPRGPVLLEAAFSTELDWPAAADGAGHSLVLARPSYGEGDVRAWEASRMVGGSPGASEPAPAPDDPYAGIWINEFLAHTDLPEVDFIELFNDGPATVDLSGCWLSDKPGQDRFEIPPGTMLNPGGFLVFDETQLGFALSKEGEGIYLRSPDATRVIDALRFMAQENGVSNGRWPDAAPAIRPLATPNPGAANAMPRSHEVAIHEIHYHPLDGDEDGTFVELHNHGGTPVDVSGWQLADGIRFTIPPATVIAPGGFLVVAKNRSRLLEIHPQLNPAATLGDFSGRLARSGERITLLKPEDPAFPSIMVLADEVHYRDGGAWDGLADGKGSSLERIAPRADGRLAPNWAASDESLRAGWTLVEHSGVLDHGMGPCNQVHLIMLAGGECLVDEVEVRVHGGPNLVANGGFDAGISGWSATGNHHETSHSPPGSGFGGGRALHLRASGGGDTGANLVRATLNTPLAAGQSVTIRARVRWLAGHPAMLVRLRGNYLEAVGNLDVPPGGGTPGQANSRAAANAGPAITAVRHHPPLPSIYQPVTVTARVEDPDGINAVTLHFRIDPASALTSVPMQRDGPRGTWTAVIPGQQAGTLAAFHITATDAAADPRSAAFPASAPARECLLRWGDPAAGGAFGHYRFWLTKATHDEWSQREKLSNQRLDATFVYQGSRIIYNAGGRFRGSPWIRPSFDTPTGNLCSYVFGFPGDEPFLGNDEINLDSLEPGRDPSRQSEKMSFWLAEQLGAPFVHQRYIILHVNGVRRDQVVSDSQHIDSDYIKSWFPDDREGAFHKIDDWFEFDTAAGAFTDQRDATLDDFTTTGGAKKQARYRWNWEKRRSVSRVDDFSELFALVDTLKLPPADPGYVAGIAQRLNVESWLRTLALRRLVGDWDSYGFLRGKNMFAYKPRAGGWHLISWDIDFTLGSGSSSPEEGLFWSHDPVMQTMLGQPPFRRAYLRAFHNAVHGPFRLAAMDPVMNANRSAFLAEGIAVGNTDSIRNWVSARRNYILGELSAVDAPFAVTTQAGQNFTSQTALVTLEGSAPVQAAGLSVNGTPWVVEWITVNTWRIRIPLGSGANLLTISATDVNGWPIPGMAASVTVTFDGIIDQAEGHLLINEIMMRPAVARGEFVEIHNRSQTTAFDLTGYRMRGVDFDFPPGTVITPGAFMLVVRDAAVFQATYGSGLPIAGTYNGVLQPDGERLRLVKMATAGQEERVISEVSYSSAPPWPQLAAGGGISLQLIDSSQGAHHIGNWASSAPTPGHPNSVVRPLPLFPNLHLNEVQTLNLTGPFDPTGSRGPWVELYHEDQVALSLDGFFLSDDPTDLTKWPFPSAAAMPAAGFRMVWLDGRDHLTTADNWHSGFLLAAPADTLTLSRTVDGAPLVISHLAFPVLPGDTSYGPWPDGSAETFLFPVATPGAPNANPSPQVAEVVMPRFMQGAVPNTARVPFAFRVRLSGLLPASTYRVANRVIVPEDPPTQNGAGNQTFVTPVLPYPRSTSSPRFLPGDFLTRHNRFTTDANGRHEGWFITEPSGNARFTPGNTVSIRLLLNDGQEGETIAHFIDCPSPVQVVAFGTGPGDATAVHGVAASKPGDFVLLEDEHPSGRPVAATVVESALSAIDANYAAFYQQQVWPHDHAWGTLVPNTLPGGITGLSEISRTTGESLGSVRFNGPWPGTVNPSGGPEPIVIDAFDRYPFWTRRWFPDPAAQSDPLVSGPLADGLGLGVPNLLAYALGLTPGDPAKHLRKLSITGGPDGAVLRFPRDPRKVDIAYLLDASPDLSGWPGVLFDSRSDPRPNNDGEFLTIPAAGPPGTACQFFRLRIEMDAP